MAGNSGFWGGGGCAGRRQGGREDEARRVGANGIAAGARGSDVAAHHAEAFGECAVDDVDPMHHAVAFGDARAMKSVQADRVNLVDEGQRVVLGAQIENVGDGGDVSVHGIDGFETHDLGRIRRCGAQEFFQMHHIIVTEDALLGARMAHAFDHRGVVHFIRNENAARQKTRKRREACLVRDETRSEQKRGFLPVQIGKLAFVAGAEIPKKYLAT